MRFSHILPLAALSAAFVVPDEQVFSELSIDTTTHARANQGAWSEQVLSELKNDFAEAEKGIKEASNDAKHALDEAFSSASDFGSSMTTKFQETAFDAKSWFESAANSAYDALDSHGDHPHPPHHGPPHHGDDPHHGGPHHGHKPNETVWQLLSSSKYTEKFSKLISEYPDLVEKLNSTGSGNFTIFAPKDTAFPDHPPHHKPSKEMIKKFIEYHISDDFYPAGRVLITHTIPTLLEGSHLPGKAAQRLSVHLGLRGLTINFYSRVVAVNIFGTNGVIHGVDNLLIPPPKAFKIIDLLPSEFSTFELALGKTGLLDAYNSTDHPSGTLFAPSNFAFQKLGPKINGFLFSEYGRKYLKALILYHTVPDNVLYSDAFIKAEGLDGIPKGHWHVDLPTALEDHSLSIDVGRYGGLIDIKVNAFSRVSVQDGIASDGVIQVVSDVLIPPKKLGSAKFRSTNWFGSEKELSLEEFKARFEPHVQRMIDL
ncbi:Fasciclin-domain-containing protein [Aureobasidium sp. EXF-3400]|nr:Fasciclin-domain-containing protein [Aureobasidium sp. EXF-12344]KAI4781489.1 Fasciclin-domain-containing protein [Aureobasidium sp. EXF-3400]